MPKDKNEVLPAGVRKELGNFKNSLDEINDLNTAIQKETERNLTETKVVKAAIQRVRKELMDMTKLCKVSRGDAIDLRNAVDAAKK